MEHYDEIIKAREIIKHKFNDIRRGRSDFTYKFEEQFKPVLDPLKELVKLKKGDVFPPKIQKGSDQPTSLPSPPKEEIKEELSQISLNENQDQQDPLNKQTVQEDADSPAGDDNPVNTEEESLLSIYISGVSHGKSSKFYDSTYGIRLDKNNHLMIGDQQISFEGNDTITVASKKFTLTPGLLELLFRKIPQGYTNVDSENYKSILELSNAHRQYYDSSRKVNRGNSYKYRLVISQLYPPDITTIRRKKGAGIFLPHSERTYLYWDDPNELVGRLILLTASKQAGHTGHDREILSIEEELREAGYIQ